MDKKQSNIFSKTFDQAQRDQLSDEWSSLFNAVTHDVTTPLIVTRMNIGNLEEIFSHLIEGYWMAVEHHLIKPTNTKERLNIIGEQCIKDSQNDTSDIIGFLKRVFNFNQRLRSDSIETRSLNASSVIEKSINNYFLTNEKPQFLHVETKNNFSFRCDPLFVDNLFLNLIDNAMRSIQRAEKGEIFIWFEEEINYNVIYFKDTASGMREYMLDALFDRFFSKREEKIVPGLGYCRLALLQRGGDIQCQSRLGEGTEFIIKFLKE